MNNYYYLIIISTISAMSRGLISVIDRYQIGYKNKSVLKVNFLNNLYTVFFIIISIYYLNINEVLTLLSNINIIIYSILVQLVALSYSRLFKKLTIFEAAITAKTSDLLIPIAIFITTGYFNITNYFISFLTTMLIVLWLKNKNNIKKIINGIIIIVPLLVIQAASAPLLVNDYKNSFHSLIIFTISTLIIRFIISTINLIPFIKKIKFDGYKELFFDKLFFIRAILTIIAQFTFVIATSSINSSISWIFLNITSLYGVIFSGLILKEKNTKTEFILIISITLIAIFSQLI